MLFATSFMDLGHHQNLDHIKPCKPLNGTPMKNNRIPETDSGVSWQIYGIQDSKGFLMFCLKDRKTIEVT